MAFRPGLAVQLRPGPRNQVSNTDEWWGMSREAANRFFYGWVIVAVSFVTLFWTLGTRFSFGIFYVAILDEYGWSRAETAGIFSLCMLTHALFAPVSGCLVDRFGPRRLFPIGALFLALGLYAASRTTSMADLYVSFGIMIAMGVNVLSYGPHMAVISKWFRRRRGLASGLVLGGIGAGMMGLAPFIQLIIGRFGWRHAFLILGMVIVALIVPLTGIFQRGAPGDVGQEVDGDVPAFSMNGDTGPCPMQPDTRGFLPVCEQNIAGVFRSRSFWSLGLAPFANGFVVNMVVVHQAAYLVDTGFSEALAASLVGMVGLLGSLGGILGGMLSDRVKREASYTASCISAATGLALLLLVTDTSKWWFLYAFVLLYGLGSGAMLPISAAKTGDLFGGRFIGRVLGLFSSGFGIGGALGAYSGGYFYDLTGSYIIPFLLSILCLGIGSGGMYMAGYWASKDNNL